MEEYSHQKKLYPINWKGKYYLEKDCGDVFNSVYTHPMVLREDCSIYLGDGLSVFPNDEMIEDN